MTNKIRSKYSCCDEDAECWFQFALVAFWQKVKNGELLSLHHHVETWMCSIIHKRMMNLREHDEIHREYCLQQKKCGEPFVGNEAEAFFEKENDHESLHGCMEMLPYEDMLVLELFYFKELSALEVMREMKLASRDAAYKRRDRALQKLKDIIEQESNRRGAFI